jgi:hypothetical protein
MLDSQFLSLARKALLLMPVVAILACSSGNPAAIPQNVTGNWQFGVELPLTTCPALPSTPVKGVFGALLSSNGTVTGTLHAIPLLFPNCVDINTDLTATGTVDALGNLSITAPLSGGTATISANVIPVTTTRASGDPGTLDFLAGTYQVVGGPCAQSPVALDVFKVANITGTYTGTFTQFFPPTGTIPNASITAILIQSATPNSDGEYPLSGTITATGGCNTTITFTQGIVAGGSAQSYPGLQTGLQFPPPPPFTNFQGHVFLGSQAQALIGSIQQPNGCPGNPFTGVLTRS